MTEELNQKISRLLDDDLSCEDALDLLMKLQGEPELQCKMSRYESMGHVLKSEAYIPVMPGFAQRVSSEIKKEPTHLATRRHISVRPYWAFSALAASVMIVAIVVSQRDIIRPQGSSTKASLLMATTESPAPLEQKKVPPSIVYDQHMQSHQSATRRLTEYLQAHNSSRYIDGTVSLQPYVQVVSYSQE
ncbi:MAG: sigma-E factor negative regulatory protein [Gammaproteobacteria bacterium]